MFHIKELFGFLVVVYLSNHLSDIVVLYMGQKIPLHYKKRALELRFGVAFFKNAASRYCLNCVLQKRSSNTGRIATFSKRGYRPALKSRFVMLRMRLAR